MKFALILVMLAIFLSGFFYGFFVRDLVDRLRKGKDNEQKTSKKEL